VAQFVVIDQILVAQRNPEHALSDQRPDLMINQFRRAAVGKTLGKPFDQSDRPVRPLSSKAPASEVILAAVKPGPQRHAPRRVESRIGPRYTLSASGLPLALRQTVGPTRFSQIPGPMHLSWVRNAG
jgi:hypothetical protein